MSLRSVFASPQSASAFLWPLLIAVTVVGCNQWSKESQPRLPRFSGHRLNPGCVILEIAVIDVKAGQLDAATSMWDQIDEQAIATRTRQQLDHNGFRVGILAGHQPAALSQLLELPPPSEAEMQLDEPSQRLVATRKRFLEHQVMQVQVGEEHWVPCSDFVEELVWTVQTGKNQRSGRCTVAQCGFSLAAETRGDGVVDLVVIPQIQFGRPRSKYRVVDNSFLSQETRQKVSLDELRIECALRPGSTLLIAPSRDATGLSPHFFEVERPDELHRRLLLVRLVQSQSDDLFAPQAFGESIVTETGLR